MKRALVIAGLICSSLALNATAALIWVNWAADSTLDVSQGHVGVAGCRLRSNR